MRAATFDAIVLGAGVAGLAAAAKLREAKLRVVVVDARARVGGRIHTLRGDGWPIPIETGAEFLHGKDPHLLKAIKAGGLHADEIEERHWVSRAGRLVDGGDSWDEAQELMDDSESPRDRSFAARVRAAGASPAVSSLAIAYVEGFHAAPAARAGTQAITQQQTAAEAVGGDTMFRVREGYDRVASVLAAQFSRDDSDYRMGTIVERIAWRKGAVELHARSSLGARLPSLRARSMVLTLPLGVLQARRGSAAVRFTPKLPADKQSAIRRLGMADVVKLLYRFREPFWQAHEARLGELSFMHHLKSPVPTWWRPLPFPQPILTGWAGGPAAAKLVNRPPLEVARLGLASLARMMSLPLARLESLLCDWRVFDWRADPFAAGAYSFIPVGALEAQAELAAPVADTIFFAGEATHTQGQSGTVHGAIATGQRAAAELLEHHRAR